jgi:hypothetical protein
MEALARYPDQAPECHDDALNLKRNSEQPRGKCDKTKKITAVVTTWLPAYT